MKKNKTGIIVILIIALFIILSGSCMVVTYPDEYTVIKQFGRIESIRKEPGLSFKLPFIQTAEKIENEELLYDLAVSPCLWEQRIAMVTCWMIIRADEYEDTLRLATLLLPHPHDLIHKAVGWMLREVGKRDVGVLKDYLAEHAPYPAVCDGKNSLRVVRPRGCVPQTPAWRGQSGCARVSGTDRWWARNSPEKRLCH